MDINKKRTFLIIWRCVKKTKNKETGKGERIATVKETKLNFILLLKKTYNTVKYHSKSAVVQKREN